METHSAPVFNPCALEEEDEVIPAKIWELLRRNDSFRADVKRLVELDAKEQKFQKSIARTAGAGHLGAASNEAWTFVRDVEKRHGFGSIALQWLVPEPIFHVQEITLPKRVAGTRERIVANRVVRIGEGTTPDLNDSGHWRWWADSSEANHSGHLMRRGPEIHWNKSNDPNLCDWVNPLEEWESYAWPFSLGHSWQDAPTGFKREFQFLWRRRCDCRPKNPITRSHSDSPAPYETSFFHAWTQEEITKAKQNPNLTTKELAKILAFDELVRDFRLFAIPRAILTKKTANEMGRWLATELKKGHTYYGDLVRDGLLNETELLGTTVEWLDFIHYRRLRDAGQSDEAAKLDALREHYSSAGNEASALEKRQQNQSHFYRRLAYMESLTSAVYPNFDLPTLLAPPVTRTHGKRAPSKGGKK